MRRARPLTRRALLIAPAAAAGLLALVVSACGVSGDGGSPSGSLTGMLGEVPDTPANRSLLAWVDVAAARELAGIASPATDDEEALTVFSGKSGPVQALLPVFMNSQAAELDAWRTEVGFTVNDIDQSIDAGVAPEMTAVARGRIAPEEVKEAVESDPSWKDELDTGDHDGVEYWRWLDDDEMDVARVTPTRSLGNSLRLQAEDGQVRWTRTDETMHDSIDAGAGDTDTLADVDELAVVAEALEDQDAYQAYLTADPGPFSVDRLPRTSPEAKEQAAAGALEPWTAAGAGDAVDGDTAVGVLVLTHEDAGTAATNEKRLRELLESGRSPREDRPYADAYEVRALERKGSTLILTVEQDRAQQLMIETVIERSLVLHR